MARLNRLSCILIHYRLIIFPINMHCIVMGYEIQIIPIITQRTSPAMSKLKKTSLLRLELVIGVIYRNPPTNDTNAHNGCKNQAAIWTPIFFVITKTHFKIIMILNRILNLKSIKCLT